MKKIFFTYFLSVLCLTTAFSADYSGTCGTNLTWELTDSVLTISGSGTMSNYTTGNSSPWYSYKEKIKTVIISGGVTSIGNYAFEKCKNIDRVFFPQSLIRIGKGSFEDCTSLTSISLPSQLEYIGSGAFSWAGLTEIDVPYSVNTIESGAFNGNNIHTATFNGDTPYYSSGLLQNNSCLPVIYWNVRRLRLVGSQDVSSIFAGTLYYSPQSIYFGDNVDTIPKSLCRSLWCLEYVEIGKNVKRIEDYAFSSCPTLKLIRAHATTPPTIGFEGFFWTSNNVDSVIVPCNCVAAYQNASGWRNMNIVGDDDCSEQPTVNTTIWNISDAAFNSLGTLTSNKTINGLTIYATSAKSVVIDESAQEIDGLSFTHRLKFGGSGASDARLLSFQVNGDCDIDIYLMSASGSADRTLNVDKGSFGNSLATIPALGSSISKGTVHYTGKATTIYLYSPSSGVNIYAIRVTEESETPQTYTVNVSSANSSMGTVSGGGTYEEGQTATVTATPKSGYKFTRWNDGSTANPYSFTVSQNVSITAYFEQSSTPQPEAKFWNISDAAFNSLGTLTSNKTINGLTIYATSAKNVVIDESAQEIDGLSFTYRLKFGGSGASDARLLSFQVDGDCDIDVYLMSASSSADRTLNVDKGSFGSSLATIPALGSSISKGTVHYTGSATTIYLYSPSSGVNIYAIRVTSSNSSEDIENTGYIQEERVQKFLHNGVLYILRGDKTYTTDGRLVR